MSFSKIFQILFIVGSTFPFFFIPEYLDNLVVFLVVILRFWWPKKSFSSISYPLSQRFMVLAYCHPLIIIFDCENSSLPSGTIQEYFQFDSSEPIISELFIPAFSSRYPNLTGASFKWSIISSWSLRSHVSRLSQVSSFFYNSTRCFIILSSFIFQFFLVMHSFSSLVLLILPVVRWRPYQVYAISLLILSSYFEVLPYSSHLIEPTQSLF